jgi:hypothetical protein
MNCIRGCVQSCIYSLVLQRRVNSSGPSYGPKIHKRTGHNDWSDKVQIASQSLFSDVLHLVYEKARGTLKF